MINGWRKVSAKAYSDNLPSIIENIRQLRGLVLIANIGILFKSYKELTLNHYLFWII